MIPTHTTPILSSEPDPLYGSYVSLGNGTFYNVNSKFSMKYMGVDYTLLAGGRAGNPGTASASSATSWGPASELFDGLANGNASAWFAAGSLGGSPYSNPPEVYYEFPTSTRMTAYRMWQRNPDANSIYAPKAWSVRGVLDGVTYDANDSSTYTEIDLQTNQFFLQTDGDSLNYNTNFNHYMTNNTTAFKKYVWRFTEGHNANDIGFGEMELYDVHASSTGITNQFTITCAVRPHNKSAYYGTIFDVGEPNAAVNKRLNLSIQR